MSRCAKEFGWHVTLLRMITGPFGAPRSISDSKEHDISVLEEKKRGEEDLIDTVLEIVFRVMWKGVEGFAESDWKVKIYFLKYCFVSTSCAHTHECACMHTFTHVATAVQSLRAPRQNLNGDLEF